MEISFEPSAANKNEWSSSSASSAPSSKSLDTQEGLLPVIKFLQSTLTMKSRGDDFHYQTLVEQLVMRDDPATVWRLYLGMCHCVSFLSQQPDEFKELIDAVFGFDWRGDDEVVEAFSTFVSHLVSANSIYMLPTMHTLVRSLVLAPRDLDDEGNVDPRALTRQRRVHEALQASLTLVPSGRSKLFGVLRQSYPHRRLRAETLSDYVLQALRVVQYAPSIEESVVRLIVEKSLEMDVEIKILDTGEAEVDDEAEEEEDGEALFTMDGLNDRHGDAAAIKNAPEADEVDKMAEKLDGVMLVLLTYLDQRLTANASLEAETIMRGTSPDGGRNADDSAGREVGGGPGRSAFGKEDPGSQGRDRRRRRSTGEQGKMMEPVARLLQSLLLVFEERILPTHRSKFVQFVVFFACARSPGLGHALSYRLLDVLTDESKPRLTRQSSVAYLASYLARALFVKAALVSKAVEALLRWATDYADRHDDIVAMPAPCGGVSGDKAFETPIGSRVRARPKSWHGSNPDPLGRRNAGGGRGVVSPMSAGMSARGKPGADHMLFYSACQATFYIMCFRGEELAAMDSITNQVAMWQRLLTCSLHPLRHCLDTVRREFARLCVGLLEEHFQADLVEELESIADEHHEPPQPITMTLSLSTPRSSSAASKSGAWGTPSKNTRAGGMGQGWNPLDSFFPFDPYLLRRSHVYVDALYNTWKAPEYGKSGRPRRCHRDGSMRTSGIDSDSDFDSLDEDLESMDATSLSGRDGLEIGPAKDGWRDNGRAPSAGSRKGSSRALAGEGRGNSWGSLGSVLSRRLGTGHSYTDNGLTRESSENMSVTSSNSVAVGCLMGRGLGKVMASSFADDGLVWDGVGVTGGGSVDDAFFHENVSPSASPPLASTLATGSGRLAEADVGVSSRLLLY